MVVLYKPRHESGRSLCTHPMMLSSATPPDSSGQLQEWAAFPCVKSDSWVLSAFPGLSSHRPDQISGTKLSLCCLRCKMSASDLEPMLFRSPVPSDGFSSGCVTRPMDEGAQGAPEGIVGDEWLSPFKAQMWASLCWLYSPEGGPFNYARCILEL